MTSQALGAEAEPGAVQRVTERILEMRQQNDSLMTYLQQLDSEASELAASNAVLAASHATLRERSAHLAEPPPQEDADAGTQRAGGGDIDDYGAQHRLAERGWGARVLREHQRVYSTTLSAPVATIVATHRPQPKPAQLSNAC